VLGLLTRWHPTPLRRAVHLEEYLGTPARIYYKDESVSPPGSHKPNTAVAQAWYNKQFGIERLTTETGAGQWGSALAFACSLVGLECKVFMVRISFDQKPFRKIMMQTWGAKCVASPSSETNFGRKILQQMPDTPGSLGIAISEAIEAAVTDPTGKTRYSLGHAFVPPAIHAGGLRYHGMAPLVCQAIVEGLMTPRAFDQLSSYEAALTWARTEGTICAPETSHAIACAIEEAKKAKEEGKAKVILFNYSGHGLMDLSGYDAYMSGKLTDYVLPEEDLRQSLKVVENLPKPAKVKTGKW